MLETLGEGVLPPFGPAASQAAVEVAEDDLLIEDVKRDIIEFSTYLINIGIHCPMFAEPALDPYCISLQMLSARLTNGRLAPSPLREHSKDAARVKEMVNKRTGMSPVVRPLEDLEDLYYASLAKLQDMRQIVSMRLDSGFNSLTDCICPGAPTMAEFYTFLADCWRDLNDPSLVKVLDNAIRRSRIKHLHSEAIAQVHKGELKQADADLIVASLYDPVKAEGAYGLAWIGGWPPAMIGAWLEEKYRVTLKVEKEEEQQQKRRREAKKRVIAEKFKAEKRRRLETAATQKREREMRRHHEKRVLEWQTKTRQLGEYSQYLRSVASDSAVSIVNNMYNANVNWHPTDFNFGASVQNHGGRSCSDPLRAYPDYRDSAPSSREMDGCSVAAQDFEGHGGPVIYDLCSSSDDDSYKPKGYGGPVRYPEIYDLCSSSDDDYDDVY